MRPPTPDELRGTTIPKSDAYRPVDKFLGRIQRATIVSVDTKGGTCTIAFESTPGQRTGVNIPVGFLTLGADGTRNLSAWSRYMPLVGDIVLVGFDSNGLPRIMGYDYISYQTIANLNVTDNFGFNALQSGEFDMMSLGGAYIKGDVAGTLSLFGGIQSIRLDKKARQMNLTSSLVRSASDNSVFRQGVVRRSVIPMTAEVDAKAGLGVPPVASPANAILPSLYESTIDLKAPVTGLPLGLPIAFSSLGNVMDPDIDLITQGAYGAVGPLGIKTVVTTGNHARFMFRIYNAVPGLLDTPIGTPGPLGGTPFRPFEVAIDALGNLIVNQSIDAFSGISMYSGTQFNLWAPLFQINALATRIGNIATAIEPEICGLRFSTITTALTVAWQAYLTATATYNAATATWTGAQSDFNTATSTVIAAQAVLNSAMETWTIAQAAFNAACASVSPITIGAALTVFTAAQTAYIAAQTAYSTAQALYVTAQATFTTAQGVFISANTTFTSAGATLNTAVAAYLKGLVDPVTGCLSPYSFISPPPITPIYPIPGSVSPFQI